jgi:hypothetical protein
MNAMKKTGGATEWHCPRCHVTVTLHVTPVTAPTHPCVKKAGTTQPLQKREAHG